MDFKEAAKLVNEIKPKTVIPIHYGKIVGGEKIGSEKDAIDFKRLLRPTINCEILIRIEG